MCSTNNPVSEHPSFSVMGHGNNNLKRTTNVVITPSRSFIFRMCYTCRVRWSELLCFNERPKILKPNFTKINDSSISLPNNSERKTICPKPSSLEYQINTSLEVQFLSTVTHTLPILYIYQVSGTFHVSFNFDQPISKHLNCVQRN